MTEVERKYLTHLWKCLKWFGREETMVCARRFAVTDPYQLSRLPELLEAEMAKQEKGKKG